jgi:hypothetical protein
MKYFTFSTLQVSIPAQTLTTFFKVRYNGSTIPPTLSISLKVISQNSPTHYLIKEIIYLYFSIDTKYQTLPPVMKMNVLWYYKPNNDQVNRTIYYCCDPNQTVMTYDYLKPVIIQDKLNSVTATKAQVQIWTRNEATLYYQLREKGSHFELANISSTNLRLHSLSLSTQTVRNSTKIVNPYQILNFTKL